MVFEGSFSAVYAAANRPTASDDQVLSKCTKDLVVRLIARQLETAIRTAILTKIRALVTQKNRLLIAFRTIRHSTHLIGAVVRVCLFRRFCGHHR